MRRAIALASLFSLACASHGQDYTVTMNNPQVFALCYENNVDTFVSCACEDEYFLVLHICIGQIEGFNDHIIIYDGLDDSAPILFDNGGMEDLTDIVFVSSNAENGLSCAFHSNDTISCATNGFIPIVWSVNCLEQAACDIGLAEVDPFSFTMAPSLAADRVRISMPEALPEAYVEVLDLSGRSVTRSRLTGRTTDLEVSGLANGGYLVQVSTPAARVTRRLIVSH